MVAARRVGAKGRRVYSLLLYCTALMKLAKLPFPRFSESLLRYWNSIVSATFRKGACLTPLFFQKNRLPRPSPKLGPLPRRGERAPPLQRGGKRDVVHVEQCKSKKRTEQLGTSTLSVGHRRNHKPHLTAAMSGAFVETRMRLTSLAASNGRRCLPPSMDNIKAFLLRNATSIEHESVASSIAGRSGLQ